MTLKLKECIKNGLTLISLVSICYFGPKLVKNYIPEQYMQRVKQYVQRTEYQPIYPSAVNKTTVDVGLGASMYDKDGDGSPDKKTIVAASRQGFHRWNLPITDQDRQVFSDITSKLYAQKR